MELGCNLMSLVTCSDYHVRWTTLHLKMYLTESCKPGGKTKQNERCRCSVVDNCVGVCEHVSGTQTTFMHKLKEEPLNSGLTGIGQCIIGSNKQTKI